MSPLSTLLIFAFVLNCAKCELCALTKTENKCLCEYSTSSKNFPELKANCKWINLKEFPSMRDFPEDLEYLDLKHNDILELEDSSTAENLRFLDLSFNNLEFVDYGFFQSFPNLEHLDLSHNNLDKLKPDAFSDLKRLRYLDLSYNSFSEFPDGLFAKLVNLKTLNIGYNHLGKYFEKRSKFFDESLGITKNLTELVLDKIDLDEVDNDFFKGGDQITYLSLSDNYFNEIPLLPKTIEYLDLSGNNMTYLKAPELTYDSLKILKLNRLQNLESIHKYGFYNMRTLEELHLENCPKLKEVDALAFGLLSENYKLTLKKLVLARSGIQKLNSTYFHLFKTLDVLDLQNNNFICDCDILWLQLLNGSYYKQQNMRCMFPTNLRNVKIMQLEEKHLPMCIMSKQSIRLQKILLPLLVVAILLLLCLIMYLVYMGPYMYRNYRGIGPESPYQHTVLREYN